MHTHKFLNLYVFIYERYMASLCYIVLQHVDICRLSKHDFIADHGQTVELLPDGSPCWKDFSQSRNNRSVYLTMRTCRLKRCPVDIVFNYYFIYAHMSCM